MPTIQGPKAQNQYHHTYKSAKSEPYHEKNITMTNEKNLVRKGESLVFDLDHLATFTVGSKQGLLKAEDGMRKLRIMEKSQGIWTMECQLLIEPNYIIVIDKKSSQEVERFPLSLIHDPTSVVSDDKKDIYNNIILFTVLEDPKKHSATPSEMHIFQCHKNHSAEIVDEIYRFKEGDRLHQHSNAHQKAANHQDHDTKQSNGLKLNLNEVIQPSKIEMEVQILNHCFDDIERFVKRLQSSSELFKELEKRQKNRGGLRSNHKSGILGMRAQMPDPEEYVDIFQKFKHSFNLLAKLKAHIHDPNAPELIHFLFTPLSLIFNTTKEQPYRGLSKTVWLPLITKEAKDLLLNCLTSKEQDLWLLLGDAWSVTLEEAKAQPNQYGHLEGQIYNPIFHNGWSPVYNYAEQDERTELTKLAFATAAQVQAQSAHKQPLPLQKQRYYSNTQPQNDPHENSTHIAAVNQHYKYMQANTNLNNEISHANSITKNNIRNYEEMKTWAIDLCYRGAKIFEVTHDRQANNDKELTIKAGELLEVLDDKRNWWRLRNYHGQVGHAPVTILRQFEFNANNHQSGNQYDAEKVGYF